MGAPLLGIALLVLLCISYSFNNAHVRCELMLSHATRPPWIPVFSECLLLSWRCSASIFSACINANHSGNYETPDCFNMDLLTIDCALSAAMADMAERP